MRIFDIKNLVLVVFVAIMAILLAGCSKEDTTNSIVVGTSADNPPYEFIQDNKIVGLDIDLIEAIAARLNKKVIIKNLDFHGLMAALTSKNVDVVIAGLSSSPERQKMVDFSDNYLTTNIAVLYRASDNLTSIADLKDRVVGVQLGTLWANIAQELAAKYGFKVHPLANNLMLVEELKSKVVDAIMMETVQAKKFIINNSDTPTSKSAETNSNNSKFASFVLADAVSNFAIALPKDSELKDVINEAISSLQKDGSIAAIKKKWLE